MRTRHQDLPASGPEREALRVKGQFWTPAWIAEAMVTYVLGGGSHSLFDPAVGAGAFFRAAETLAVGTGKCVRCSGTEVDLSALDQARANGVSEADLARVELRDFVLDPPAAPLSAIVANPPYIRHHRISAVAKRSLKQIAMTVLGRSLDGRAGLHIYFLIRALQMLEPGGRLAFILPADTCEGVSAPTLWKWIAANYRIDAVITFSPDATPFPGVDTNPLIVLIRRTDPGVQVMWARCETPETQVLTEWVRSGLKNSPSAAISVHPRPLDEALATGLSRPPSTSTSSGSVLGDFARVMRGIATGANEYFYLTRQQAALLGIPEAFLRLAVGRTRDVPGDELTDQTFRELEHDGRPVFLFSPDGRAISDFPEPVRRYLEHGEDLQLPRKALISQRHPWYKMEVRDAPPFLFAYLGRRNARFIRNTAGGVPLTGFLCVYPKSGVSLEKLWAVLQHPETVRNLALVGKSYGSGAIKVEPRSLERLPLPAEVLGTSGLDVRKADVTGSQLAMPM